MTIRFPVGGNRQAVHDHLRDLGFVQSKNSDKRWHRADGIEAHIFGAGSMVQLNQIQMPLDKLEDYLKR